MLLRLIALVGSALLACVVNFWDCYKSYITSEFGYDLSRACDEIRPAYHHDESCQRTVPEAITAFLEGQSFEDVIRTAVSLGGDCDTLTCIAGGIAEAGVIINPWETPFMRTKELIEIIAKTDKWDTEDV